MKLLKPIESMSIDELLDKLGFSIIFAFCIGFIIGVFLIVMVFVVQTSDFYKNTVIPVSIILFFLAFLVSIKYLRKTLIPEIKKRCEDK